MFRPGCLTIVATGAGTCPMRGVHRCATPRRGVIHGMARAGAKWAVIGAVLVTSSASVAQSGDDKTPAFQATVLDMSGNSQRITVPLHRSATIETSVEITRADVVARQIADVQVLSPTRLLVTGNSFGNTSIVLQGADKQQYIFDISVELDVEGLNEALKAIDPLSTARARSLNGSIVLAGEVSSLDNAERMTDVAGLFLPPSADASRPSAVQNHLQLAGEQQVMIRVVVAEVNRKASRELGVNGFLAGENFDDGFLLNQLGGINPINIGAAGGANVSNAIPFFTDENGIIVTERTTFSIGFPRGQGQIFIHAMADNSLLRVLAEPNLVAVSGETATFLAGGEFPIPVPQGNQTVTIEFREYGVRLTFTPLVRGGQRIRLKVSPEVSELDFTTAAQFQGFVIPGLTARSATTTVELGSGQTIAIAGLLSEQARGIASRIPGLGDLPILGTLFRSVNFERSLSDLVILVTPEIVAPLDPHQSVELPGIDQKDPSDMDLYVLGILDAKETPAKTDPGADSRMPTEPEETSFHGPWGHADNMD